MPRHPNETPDATLRVLVARGLGSRTLDRLRRALGDDDAIVAASAGDLAAVRGIGARTAGALRQAIDHADPARERDDMRATGARLILRSDDDYPALLAAIPDPPAALWIRGGLNPADRLGLAVIGSRKCSAYGREQASRFAGNLAECGLTIVSGGAAGIDGEAHRAALRVRGRTIAVLGCGLGRAYPLQHRRLFEEIVAAGSAVVSEHPMSMPPRPEHFPRRNRIISGLSVGVLVVEAARRSGALITARLAADEHGREVMAVPGRIDSPSSAGALEALRDGWAAAVLSPADVLQQLDGASHLVRGAMEAASSGQESRESGSAVFAGDLTAAQQSIVEALGESQGGLDVDQLGARTGLAVERLLGDLTILEIRGQVCRCAGGYRRARRRRESFT